LPPTIGADDESAVASRAARRIRLVDPVVVRGAVRARTPGVTIPELDEEYDDEDKEGEHPHRPARKHLASPSFCGSTRQGCRSHVAARRSVHWFQSIRHDLVTAGSNPPNGALTPQVIHKPIHIWG